METRTKKRKPLVLYAFLGLVGVLFAILYIIPTVTGALTPTSLIGYGEIKTVDQAEIVVVRSEKIVVAKAEGEIRYYFEEGEYLRKGTKVLDIAGHNEDYVTAQSGYVSYLIDGLETKLTPVNMRELKHDETNALRANPEKLIRKNAKADEPVYKMIDGRRWYAVFWVDRKAAAHYGKGQPITLLQDDAEIPGKVHYLSDDGQGGCKIILEFDRYFQDLTKERRLKAEIVSAAAEGLIIDNASITSREGKPGVFVRNLAGQFDFVPVSVLASDGRSSIVADTFFYEKKGEESVRVTTVKVYDEILNRPEKEKVKP